MISPLQTASSFRTAQNTNTQTVTFSTNLTAGSLVVVYVATFGTNITLTVTGAVNATYTQASSVAITGQANYRAHLFYFVNSGSGSETITVTPSGSAFVTMMAMEYAGATASAFVASGSSTSAGSTTPSTGTITASAADTLITGAVVAFNNTTFPTTIIGGSGSTVTGVIHSAFAIAMYTVNRYASTSAAASLTLGASTAWACAGASFAAQPSTGTTNIFGPTWLR